jgi:NAD(P)-dependent dehydrogenase (short-subunit alcohol dehydrogenase family)
MASIASLIGVKDRFAYSMSKGAVLAMTYATAIDYSDHNVRCNCICPARVHTPFVDNFIAQNYPGQEQATFEKLSAYQPLGRMGQPDEVAALAVYLSSDEASFCTGNAYPVDGGVTHAR